MKNKSTKKLNKGFTLVELMVSTSIFSIIMLSSIGALFTLLGVSRNSRAAHTAMDNINFALESIVRSIGTGTGYACGDNPEDLEETAGEDCKNGGSVLSFFHQKSKDNRVFYYKRDNKIYRKEAEDDEIQLVSDDIKIDDLTFYVVGAGIRSQAQPRVFIKIKGEAKIKDSEYVPFNIQTLVSQRNYKGATSGPTS